MLIDEPRNEAREDCNVDQWSWRTVRLRLQCGFGSGDDWAGQRSHSRRRILATQTAKLPDLN